MIRWKACGSAIMVYLSGELDHFAAEKLREKLEKLIRIQKPEMLTLDFSDVTFMDSSGVGMLIGRYKTMTALGGKVCACSLSTPVERLYRMAGLHRIIPIVQEERREEA